MNTMKKLAAMILSICLIVPCFSQLVYAADGTLQFTDPEATQGQTVTIEGVLRSEGDALQSANVTMTYDTSALEFVSGDNTSGTAGTLSYAGTGNGSDNELRFNLKFNVLTSGASVVTATTGTATTTSGESVNLVLGTSTVSAAEGDGTTAYETPAGAATPKTTAAASAGTGKITVNEQEYDFSDSFTSADIPEGYEETTLNYDGADRKFVKNATSGVTLGYLVNASGEGSFFLYNTDNASFSPYIELAISDTTSIILLSEVTAVKLPNSYQAMELTVNDYVFPAWQDMNNQGFYVLYALDGTGSKSLYQYENTDGTYQKFIASAEDDTVTNTGKLAKIQDFVQNHFKLVALILIALGLLALILLIVLAVKLHNRNEEIDDLYEEYDIPEEYDEPKNNKINKKSRKKEPEYDDEDDEEYGDDDEYDDYDEYDDEYDDYDDDDDEYYDDDEYLDDEDDDNDDINFIDI